MASAAYTVTGNVSDPRVATGATHSLVVKRDGTVWATGSNGWGYLGDGSTNPRTTLGLVAGLTGIRSIAAGVSHSAAVGQDGRLHTWGANSSRQLGDGTTVSYRTTPTLITGVPAMVSVAAGQNHTLALTSTGEVYAFGSNASGQIGNASQTTTTAPVLVAGLPAIAGIAAGDNHSLAWTSTGQLYAWGANSSYQLGDGSNTMRTSPVLISAVTGVAQAVAGASHTLVRAASGEVRAWGRNFEGQLADGTTTLRTAPTLIPSLTGVVAIGAGANHSLASTASATFTWGANGSWQLGDNANPAVNRTSPFAVAGLVGSVQLGGGTTHSAAVDTGGAIWLWGGNTSGQLGNGSNTTDKLPAPTTGDVAMPTASSESQTCTIDPGPRICTSEQLVTLTSATPGAIVRYTLTGIDPVDTDPIASGLIAISQNTTLKAKGWKAPLSPSTVLTATYQLKVATPSMSEAGQTSTTPITVSLETTTPGAIIRYTLDGTQPGPSSAEYTTALVIAQSGMLQALALKPGWTSSETASATYAIVVDQRPPTITARVRPGVNAAGWTMGPATVSFICHDVEGPVQGCPAEITVPGETNNHPFTGTVTDAANNSASASGVVKVDATAPVLALTSPADGLEVATPFVTLTGTASDAMSGLAAVRCNHVLATVSNGNVTCDVPLRPGRNPVVLQASDVAGHSTSIGLVVWRTAALDRLTLSPQQLTMHEGDEQPLRLVNNMGRVQTNAAWSVDAPTVVEVVEEGEPTLRALAPGTATVTATVGAFSAQSTVTVVGATVVFAPGTTRWLVQVTPGQNLDGVIYTHQTSPDVPEAVLVESAGANVQLRGVSDGATTSITPVSGPAPFQTMGDSFGGVLLAQEDGETRTALQRIGFTPEVAPCRWVSGGVLSGIVQIHDGTIFATERVSNAEGLLSAASIVVLDGSTGSVRSRVPITASSYSNHHSSELGPFTCVNEPPTVRDDIGLSSYSALTTADTYGVVTFEGHSIWRNCGGVHWGSGSGAQHLLAVDRNGGATTTQLSQHNEVWPSSQGGLSTPAATGLAADARGNFVVTLANEEQQLFGRQPTGPVLPITEGVIVSDDGVHVSRTTSNLVARDVDTGAALWSSSSPGVPVAFASERRRAVVLSHDDCLFEVGPDATGNPTCLGSASDLRHLGSGRFSYRMEAAFAAIQASGSRTPLIVAQGNPQAQGSPRFEAVPMMVPENPFEGQGDMGFEDLAATLMAGFGQDPTVATIARFDREAATASRFLTEVAKESTVFALISHTSIDGVNYVPPQATGLCLSDYVVFTADAALAVQASANCYGRDRYVRRRVKVDVGSSVLFLAGCKIGSLVEGMLGFSRAVTNEKVLIFAKTTEEFPRLGVGAAALAKILREWKDDVTISMAVELANQWIMQQSWITGVKEQYEVVGNVGLKAPRR